MRYATRREQGNALILALMMVVVMAALSTAQFVVVQKNSRQADFIGSHESLRRYANSGIHLAIHDLRYDISGYDGNLGSTAWTTADDVGRDGSGGTSDYGEGDGIPTPGEPNLNPQQVGAAALGMNLVVYTTDTAYFNTKHIVSVAWNQDTEAVVEVYVKGGPPPTIPRVASMYIDPDVVLDLKGNSFFISGYDTDPDGSPGPESDYPGIATEEGSPPGDNLSDLISQIPAGREDQVVGMGSDPSVAEVTASVDINALFDALKGMAGVSLTPGTYSNSTFGTSGSPEITYVSGNLKLSGTGTGNGILLVDGNLDMTGSFQYAGMVIVRGDVRQTGGGSSTHIYGSMMITESFSVTDTTEITVSGNADIVYSSSALDAVDSLVSSTGTRNYSVVYWNSLK